MRRDHGHGRKRLTGADRGVIGSLAVGFVGLTFHNLREFPVSVLVRGDTLIVLTVTVALGLWWLRVRSLAVRYVLLGWGLLHVIGGGLIVGGGLVPFVSDVQGAQVTYQLRHHISHWVYGAAYLPLVAVAVASRSPGRDQRGHTLPPVTEEARTDDLGSACGCADRAVWSGAPDELHAAVPAEGRPPTGWR